MTQNFDNRKRAFTDVVTIDAWHQAFETGVSAVDLHADVVFGIARVGGEPESKVRFRLSVHRAEIVVIVPESEPVTVDKRSVSRDAPELEGKVTRTKERSRKGKVSAAAKIGPHPAAGVDAEASVVSSEKVEISGPLRLFAVTQSQTADGQYRWVVESQTEGCRSQVDHGTPPNALA